MIMQTGRKRAGEEREGDVLNKLSSIVTFVTRLTFVKIQLPTNYLTGTGPSSLKSRY